jgi:hypothetical protein
MIWIGIQKLKEQKIPNTSSRRRTPWGTRNSRSKKFPILLQGGELETQGAKTISFAP